MSNLDVVVSVNKSINSIIINGSEYQLSKSEITLLELLYNNPNSVFSAFEIARICWLGRVVSNSSIPVAVKHIRDVFRNNAGRDIILTKKGEGYQFYGSDIKIIFLDIPSPVQIEAQHNSLLQNKNDDGVIKKLHLNFLIFIMIFFIFLILYKHSYEYIKYSKIDGVVHISNGSISSKVNKYNLKKNDSIFIDRDYVITCHTDDKCDEYQE